MIRLSSPCTDRLSKIYSYIRCSEWGSINNVGLLHNLIDVHTQPIAIASNLNKNSYMPKALIAYGLDQIKQINITLYLHNLE
jgi:hypothetical protein